LTFTRHLRVRKATRPTVGATILALLGFALGTTPSPAFASSLVSDPTITNINPVAGAACGGDVITFTGTNFQGVDQAMPPNPPNTTAPASKPNRLFFRTGPNAPIGTWINAAGVASVASDGTSFTATTPGMPAGTYDVVVYNVGFTGESNTTNNPAIATGAFTVLPFSVPTVTGLTNIGSSPPPRGPAGGTSLTISGHCLSSVTKVMFGTDPTMWFDKVVDSNCTSPKPGCVSSASNIAIAVDSPAFVANPTLPNKMDVRVKDPAHTSGIVPGDVFTYDLTPTVGQLSTHGGASGGGDSVTITGDPTIGGLYKTWSNTTAVKFGNTSVDPANYVVNDDNTITVTKTPPGTGTVDVTVTTNRGVSATSFHDSFTYLDSPPAVTSLQPHQGPAAGGNAVQVHGSGLGGTTQVAFGSNSVNCPAACTVVNDSEVDVAHAPAGTAGTTVDVKVTNSAGQSAANPGNPGDSYTYIAAPAVSGVSPSSGPSSGGQSVTISGSGFSQNTTVISFGSTDVTSGFTVNDDNHITVSAPTHVPGTVDVTVKTDGGTTAVNANDKYTFIPPQPAVASIAPTSGTVAGGTLVTINGGGFDGGSGAGGGNGSSDVLAVYFGGTAVAPTTANGFQYVNSGQIKIMSPRLPQSVSPPAALDVTVRTHQGVSQTNANDKFTYQVVPGQFVALPKPVRICDTRPANADNTTFCHDGTLGPGQTIDVPVTGLAGVPTHGVASVIANITAVPTEGTAQGGFFTAYPTGQQTPNASNLNFGPGPAVPNLAQIEVGDGDSITVFNANGSNDLIIDITGYTLAPVDSSGAGLFNPINPSRISDTRHGSLPNHDSTIGPNSFLDVQVTGAGGVPASGADSVVVNVTAVPTASTQAGGFLTVYPTPSDGSGPPNVSNLNFGPGPAVPNRVVVRIGNGGMIRIYNFNGHTDVLVDANGWFTSASGSGAGFTPQNPSRLMDTRGAGGPLGAGQIRSLQVRNGSGLAPANATAVVVNVTATGTTAPGGFLTVSPHPGSNTPSTSDLNFGPGQTIANLVVVRVGTNDSIDIFNNNGSTQVIVDLEGYYTP
jgi:hypothetical protein